MTRAGTDPGARFVLAARRVRRGVHGSRGPACCRVHVSGVWRRALEVAIFPAPHLDRSINGTGEKLFALVTHIQ